jgi:WD40 repeat protein
LEPIATPTSTPTPTVIVPALNQTAMPPVSDEINPSNVEDLRLLKQTTSNRHVYLLDAEGSRYFRNFYIDGEVRDVATNEVLWHPVYNANSQINHEGTQVISYLNGFSELQIQYEDGKTESFTIPAQTEPKRIRSFSYNYQKRLLSVAPLPGFWESQKVTAEVYSLDTKKPVYSIEGGSFWFTWTGKYLYYKQGKLLIFADAETGEKISEFGLEETDELRLSWDEEMIAFSRNGVVEVWRIRDRKMLRVIQIQKETILESNDLMFSKGNKALMILHPDGNIRTWNIETGEILQQEESGNSPLYQMRVTDDGKIIRYEFPEFPGQPWMSDLTLDAEIRFSSTGDVIEILNQITDGYPWTAEECNWDLLDRPSCTYRKGEIWMSPANFRLLNYGNDQEKYSLKSQSNPVTLHHGWEPDGEFITQLPTLSIKGEIKRFLYDPFTNVLITIYDSGDVFILNHKTNARLLVDPRFVDPASGQLRYLPSRYDQYFFSKDHKSLYAIFLQKDSPLLIDFVQYDSETLKEISRVTLNNVESFIRETETESSILSYPFSSTFSADGDSLYILFNYYSLTDRNKVLPSALLTLPLESPESAEIVATGYNAEVISNILVTKNDDLLIYSEVKTGDLLFFDPGSGKEVGKLQVGGHPINLAISPDNRILAVGDQKTGILLFGVPAP